MKKMIYIIIAALILLVALLFILSNGTKDISIKKEVTINAPLNQVFEQVRYYDRFKTWSPFYEADPTQTLILKGTDGEVGAQLHWEGNKGKDLGYQEIKEIQENQRILMACDIQKPFKSNPTFEYFFTSMPGKTKVVQEFKLKSGSIDALFMWLFGAKKDIAAMNARGLALLKQTLEN